MLEAHHSILASLCNRISAHTMRLLRTGSYEEGNEKLELVEVFGQDIPKYAILSHTWGRDEVTLKHVLRGTAQDHEAYDKVISAIQEAASDGLEYIWIDSCCIDKSSSAELSESINSMYTWYERSEVCYAILEDVPGILAVDFRARFTSSRWFTRGWTLQELLAPKCVLLYGKTVCGGWTPPLGDRTTLAKLISEITSIEIDYLTGLKSVHCASIAKRMSWAAKRQTKREEDLAYCLLGLFSVNMSMLYGEGTRAFTRLEEEIMKISDDQSIFAWTDISIEIAATCGSDRIEKVNHHLRKLGPVEHSAGPSATPVHTIRPFTQHGLLAKSPAAFSHSGHFVPWVHPSRKLVPYQMTNRGLSISLNLTPLSGHYCGGLFAADIQCSLEKSLDEKHIIPIGVYLQKISAGPDQFARVRHGKLAVFEEADVYAPGSAELTALFVRQTSTDLLEHFGGSPSASFIERR
jgi:hypothetical protein